MIPSLPLLPAAAALLFLALSVAPAAEPDHPADPAKVTPAEALALLKAGNQRFVTNTSEHPRQSALRRTELATGQRPFAIVLGCADSRTSPEVIFDQWLGDIFVVRVAGNVLNDETLGSIEYAVEHLGAQLIVVLGHERCGAVKAAKEAIAAHAEAHGHIGSLVKAIEPAVAATTGADAETTAKTNVLQVAQHLRDCAPILKDTVKTGRVAVIGAYYDLDTGAVEYLEEVHGKHP